MTTSRTGAAHRGSRGFLVGSWAVVVLGVVHLLFMAVSPLLSVPAAEEAARTAMADASSRQLGLPRSMLALYYGFSAAMGLFAVGFGAVNLLVLRHAPGLTRGRTSLVSLDLAVSVLAAAIAVASFPPPAIGALSVAVVGYAVAFLARR